MISEEQKVKKIVDINVIRKGLNFHGANSKDLKQEQEDIVKEEEIQEREKAIASKNQKTFGKEEKKKPEAAEANTKVAEEDEREGKLKMVEVQNLPDDVDMIVS